MDPSPLTVAALIFGFSSSLHCAAMCGPLASCAVPRRVAPTVGYAGARIAAYATGGAVAGACGQLLAAWVPRLVVPMIGVVGALFLLGRAAGVSFPWFRGGAPRVWLGRALAWAGARSPFVRGAVFGAATAVLPCGVLASVYALSAATGSAHAGGVSAAAFAVGSTLGVCALPAALRLLLPGGLAERVQRAGLVVAACTLLARSAAQARGGPCCLP